LGKRVSPLGETIFALRPASLKPLDAQNKSQHQQLTYTINCQQSASTSNFNSTRQYKLNGDQSKIKPAESLSPAMDLEEVAPLAMTEVKDNEGDTSLEVWQNGGRSNGGFGAPSALANYLKELHKKLKRTWLPPSGPAHHIKVLFRLDADGSIISMKLISSSGESAADKSALEAVNKAAPFGKLPKDYTSRFLDIAYTFNYNTDELNEIASPKE
jgi:TonB family protein